MGSRHPNPRLAKIHRSYSVDEVSRLFKIHKNTARNWLREGLTAIDDQRPAIVQGVEDRETLHGLLRQAITCPTLEAFREALHTQS